MSRQKSEEQILSNSKQIKNQMEQIQSLKSTLSQKLTTIQHLNKELSDQNNIIHKYEEDVKSKEVEISSLNKKLMQRALTRPLSSTINLGLNDYDYTKTTNDHLIADRVKKSYSTLPRTHTDETDLGNPVMIDGHSLRTVQSSMVVDEHEIITKSGTNTHSMEAENERLRQMIDALKMESTKKYKEMELQLILRYKQKEAVYKSKINKLKQGQLLPYFSGNESSQTPSVPSNTLHVPVPSDSKQTAVCCLSAVTLFVSFF